MCQHRCNSELNSASTPGGTTSRIPWFSTAIAICTWRHTNATESRQRRTLPATVHNKHDGEGEGGADTQRTHLNLIHRLEWTASSHQLPAHHAEAKHCPRQQGSSAQQVNSANHTRQTGARQSNSTAERGGKGDECTICLLRVPLVRKHLRRHPVARTPSTSPSRRLPRLQSTGQAQRSIHTVINTSLTHHSRTIGRSRTSRSSFACTPVRARGRSPLTAKPGIRSRRQSGQ